MDNNVESNGPALKRLRAARACEMCRLKKNKCDELRPCTHCRNRKTECVYRGGANTMRSSRTTPEYVHQLEEQIKALSSALMASNTSRGVDLSNEQQNITGEAGVTDCTQPRPRSGDSSFTWCRAAYEVGVVNRHTHSSEFYGSSSSIAILAHVRRASAVEGREQPDDEEGLVSSLHNPAFSSSSPEALPSSAVEQYPAERLASVSHCRVFVDNFFATIHYIYPILAKPAFLEKCELVWAGKTSSLSQSFIALYYSILSLGALLRPREEGPIGGIEDLLWSRKFFDEARTRSNSSTITDLEMVQCHFYLAKVCQNALNLHWAYLQIGQAVRIALSIGINREPSLNCVKDPEVLKAESRTWWCLYFLETELAFSIGRPDTLGADIYHNRRYPITTGDALNDGRAPELLEPPQCAIIKHMVDISRLIRTICVNIYMSNLTLEKTIAVAAQIQQRIERWVETLPPELRPLTEVGQRRPLKAAMVPQYVKKQRLATTTRYHNLRILLFGRLLMKSSMAERASNAQLQEQIGKCLDSARLTIEIVYETFQHQDFFRTWFYNTTYTIFAASIILVYIFQAPPESEYDALSRQVETAIEILETMEESVVAAKAAKLIQTALISARERTTSFDPRNAQTTLAEWNFMPMNGLWGPFNMACDDPNADVRLQFSDFGVDCSLFDDIIEAMPP
ncbi:fungal-specific transcription factor domain-containing protein [Aspergillus sergii]|uniref:Fungal-specific transcription factor domain-containing protein n=1 Tax=Aspergillus sergii TaxID=1034303 RepID=A0A5N6WZD7_9EURO|nr:fungal-specific transcription factor domain-containing protein [Aspergillus sergii]